jgi:hypothetical protein
MVDGQASVGTLAASVGTLALKHASPKPRNPAVRTFPWFLISQNEVDGWSVGGTGGVAVGVAEGGALGTFVDATVGCALGVVEAGVADGTDVGKLEGGKGCK